MRLTKKKAIELVKELWGWVAEKDGRRKEDWPGLEKYGKMIANCPLCEYADQHRLWHFCDPCPYFKQFGDCCEKDTPYDRWFFGHKASDAREFLEQLKQLEG